MRRSVVLGTLVALGVVTAVIGAQQPAAQPKVVTVEKLKDNLYMLGGMGGGGNTAVFIGANGITVVDTKNPDWGQPILDAIRKISDKPVSTIINTHTHGDHTSGNVEFPASVEVVTHANTAANMQKMAAPSGLPPATRNIFKEHGGHGLPKRTFTDRLTLGRGADQIDLYYFGRGHTNGDAWVVFPALRVMHAGDIFSGKNVPLLDGVNGGSGVAIGETLARAHAATVKNVDQIITGHSTVMTPADLLQYSEFNNEFLAAVQAGKKAGQTVEQIAATWKIPAKYTGYAEPAAMRLLSNVRVTYDEIR
jgi:glyoxylase-like metal-dependent hydrolase (beta-lactamase superfamily II)